MRLNVLQLTGLMILISTPVMQAGIIFNRSASAPVVPEKRIPELISVLRTSPDAHQREDAVEELRQFDPAKYPEVPATIAEILMNDPSTSVRVEAARTLGRMRPITQVGGQALEHALDKDSAMRVRLQARSALLQYRWRGYRSSDEPLKTVEPGRKDPNNNPELKPVPNSTVPPVIETDGANEPPTLDPLTLPNQPATVKDPGALPNLPLTPVPATQPNRAAPPTTPRPLPLGKPGY